MKAFDREDLMILKWALDMHYYIFERQLMTYSKYINLILLRVVSSKSISEARRINNNASLY
jgi:hypothetical protein